MITVGANQVLRIPANRVSSVPNPHVIFLRENMTSRANGSTVDGTTIDDLPPSDDTIWSVQHNTAASCRVRPTDITWPATGFGAAGAQKSIEHYRATSGGFTSYMGNQSATVGLRMISRWWFTSSTGTGRNSGLYITSDTNGFSGRNSVYAVCNAASASNAWELRIGEIVANVGTTMSSVALSNTAGQMIFDLEFKTNTNFDRFVAIARQYNTSGTLLANETLEWNPATNKYKGDWKMASFSSDASTSALNFLEVYEARV